MGQLGSTVDRVPNLESGRPGFKSALISLLCDPGKSLSPNCLVLTILRNDTMTVDKGLNEQTKCGQVIQDKKDSSAHYQSIRVI